MKFQEIEKMSVAKLQEELQQTRVKLRELNFSLANSQVKNVREVRQLKQLIARLLTVLNKHRLAQIKEKKG